jgi:hypothetical protein
MTLTRPAFLLVMAAALGGCFAPPSNSQKVTEAARELNVNSRFGRMDMAASYASPAARQAFLERRATWGNLVRVMDVELASLNMDEERKEALVEVVVSWMRVDESHLRATRVAQVWREKNGDWMLTREKRVAGDVGLFGEHVEVQRAPTRDVQYPTTTLR